MIGILLLGLVTIAALALTPLSSCVISAQDNEVEKSPPGYAPSS